MRVVYIGERARATHDKNGEPGSQQFSAHQDGFQDWLPVQVHLRLVILDANRVEPLLDGVQVLRVDGIDAVDLLGEVLEHNRHVKVLQREADALEVHHLDFLERDHQKRGLD